MEKKNLEPLLAHGWYLIVLAFCIAQICNIYSVLAFHTTNQSYYFWFFFGKVSKETKIRDQSSMTDGHTFPREKRAGREERGSSWSHYQTCYITIWAV